MFIKNQKGGAIVEFAIVLPLLVLIIGGVIELGLLFYNEQVIINASREGARAGIIADVTPPLYSSTNGEIENIITNYCTDNLIAIKNPHDDVTITLTPLNRDFTFESPFTVKVQYDYEFLLPSILGLGASTTLTGLTTMLNQHVIED